MGGMEMLSRGPCTGRSQPSGQFGERGGHTVEKGKHKETERIKEKRVARRHGLVKCEDALRVRRGDAIALGQNCHDARLFRD
jgi:hypothetical protein